MTGRYNDHASRAPPRVLNSFSFSISFQKIKKKITGRLVLLKTKLPPSGAVDFFLRRVAHALVHLRSNNQIMRGFCWRFHRENSISVARLAWFIALVYMYAVHFSENVLPFKKLAAFPRCSVSMLPRRDVTLWWLYGERETKNKRYKIITAHLARGAPIFGQGEENRG
jgi:hypothetical protein